MLRVCHRRVRRRRRRRSRRRYSVSQMDWSLVVSTFALVFVAEMGGKTQLAAISLAATTRRPFSIAAGAIGALAAGTVLAVLVGQLLPEVLPPAWTRRFAGGLFLATGLIMMFRRG